MSGRFAVLRVVSLFAGFAWLAGCASQPTARSAYAQKASPAATNNIVRLSFDTRQQPTYPGFEALYGITGTAVVLILVGPDGVPVDVKLHQSTGSADLDKAAIDAAKAWRFNPQIKNGKAVEGYARVPVTFAFRYAPRQAWPSVYRSAPIIEVDNRPIRYATVAQTAAAVAAQTNELAYAETSGAFHIYRVYDKQHALRAIWYVTDLGTRRAMAIRYIFGHMAGQPVVFAAELCNRAEVCRARASLVLRGPIWARATQDASRH